MEPPSKLIAQNACNFIKHWYEFNFKFDEFKNHSRKIVFIRWFNELVPFLGKIELKTRCKIRKPKRIIKQGCLEKHVFARYIEHQY